MFCLSSQLEVLEHLVSFYRYDLKDIDKTKLAFNELLVFRKNDNSESNLLALYERMANFYLNDCHNLAKTEEIYIDIYNLHSNNQNKPGQFTTLNRLARFYRDTKKDFDQADYCYKKIIILRHQNHSPESEIVNSYLELSAFYREHLKDSKKAFECLSDALIKCQHHVCSFIKIHDHIARLVNETQAKEHLLEIDQKIDEITQQTNIDERVEAIKLLDELAFEHRFKVRNYKRARHLYDQILKLKEKVEPANYETYVATLENMKKLYLDPERINEENKNEAKTIAEQIYKKIKLHLPEGHPKILEALISLGDFYRRYGSIEMSMKCFEKALAIRNTCKPRSSADVVEILKYLVEINCDLGRLSAAQEYLEKITAERKSTLPENNSTVLNSYRNLISFCRLKSKDYAKA